MLSPYSAFAVFSFLDEQLHLCPLVKADRKLRSTARRSLSLLMADIYLGERNLAPAQGPALHQQKASLFCWFRTSVFLIFTPSVSRLQEWSFLIQVLFGCIADKNH